MENINKIKEQIKTDNHLPTALKGISIDEYNDSNMATSKLANMSKDSKDIYNLILSFNKPISKCL